MKALRVTIAAAVLAVALAAATGASAKWIIGNGTTDLEIIGPNPALPGTVCSDHIVGRAGLNTTIDPAVTPPPAGPYAPIAIDVFTGPAGSLDGSTREAGGLRTPAGDLVPPLYSTTTVAPTALNPIEFYDDFTGTIYYEYAAAPLDITIPPALAATIAVGDAIAVKKSSYSAFVSLSAVKCATTPPPPVAATIDILPGIASNPVPVNTNLPILIVRVFGSAALDVNAITGAKLGTAPAVTIPASLARYFVPRDRNGDGFLDRDLLFVPAQTGATCATRSLSLTGGLAGTTTFAGSDAIRPLGCGATTTSRVARHHHRLHRPGA